MSEKNAVSPVEKKRLALLKEMTPACRKVAEDFDTKMSKSAQGVIMISYDMGSRLREVVENEGEYGSKAVETLAAYLNVKGGATTLYGLRDFAESFDREFVKANSVKPMANGDYLTLQHWSQLRKIAEQKDREKLLNRVFKESLSANELEKEVRAGSKTKHSRQGGRKPGIPTSVLAGVQQTLSIGNKFVNLEDVVEKHVFDKIDEMPADQINDTLLEKLGECKETLESLGRSGTALLRRVEKGISRVTRVLEKKADQEAKAAEKAEAHKSADETVPARPAKAKAGKKAGKKKAKKRRQIEVV